MIFHIAHVIDWVEAVDRGEYRVASLDSEGFIHLSTRGQVLATAGRYYRGVDDLMLLAVDEAQLDPALLRFELGTGGETFPHYYAGLPVGAVRGAPMFVAGADGEFLWPSELA